MKRCLTCNSSFDDESLSYCTNDGSVLVREDDLPRPDPQATQLFTEPRPTLKTPPPPTARYGPLQPPPQPQPPRPYGWANDKPSWTPPPPPGPVAMGPSQGLAVASLVLGLVSMTIGWCCYFGVLTGPIAVGLGIFSLVQIKNQPSQYTGKPLAIVGIVTGGLYFVLLFFVILIYGLGVLAGGLK